MTILEFRRREPDSPRPARFLPVAVTGGFGSPAGGVGRFRGAYRLQRVGTVSGRPVAVGWVAGELLDADGRRIGFASRRLSAELDVAVGPTGLSAQLGPIRVNLLGLCVLIDRFHLTARDETGTSSNLRARSLDRHAGGTNAALLGAAPSDHQPRAAKR